MKPNDYQMIQQLRAQVDELLLLASGSATDDEGDYLEPLQAIVSNRITLAGTWRDETDEPAR